MRSKLTTPQNRKDLHMTRKRLANFDWNRCAARYFLSGLFGERIDGANLLSLAQVISEELRIYLDREATRRKTVLYKWFDENLDRIQPFVLSSVVIETRSGTLIGAAEPRALFDKAQARLSNPHSHKARSQTLPSNPSEN